ncbi:hypothetical protein DFH05DRAFT_1524288 [Lentinula detonsa]|uniref:CCHC-type domain-containing protein n=1 Tax=Lentinula detonsa TaxID=2804962 RepID=A0A9W8P155_9AGAR|nr:hypothetical protein DFH05DRAFT_1524288 [Lentinula detonsa]
MDEAELVEMVEGTGRIGLPQSTSNSSKPLSSSAKIYNGNGGRWKSKMEVNEPTRDNNDRTINRAGNDTKPPTNYGSNNGRRNGSSVQKTAKKRLSDKEKDEYRAAGKCFECGETTHRAWDCPKKCRDVGGSDEGKRSTAQARAQT